MSLKISLVIILFLFFAGLTKAQQAKTLKPLKISGEIKIDGIINEAEWIAAPVAGDFMLNFPSDSALASGRTIVKVLYNDEYLYISARLENGRQGTGKYVVSSLKRDFMFLANDAFGVVIDPFNDHTNGYGFYVSALGVLSEEQIHNGNISDPTWDIKWFSAAQRDSLGYTVEMAIPFRYLRFSASLADWNVNFLRNDIRDNERSSWAPTPRNFIFPNLSYSGKLLWPQTPKQTVNNISLFPSLTYNASQERKEKIKNNLKPSLDAKITLTSSLNLDLTVNPDFSQAEVDQAQVNLSRFDISYPEKRLFFIENSDLFSAFGVNKEGSAVLQPFYSRNIGLKYNPTTGQYEQTSIIGGARLSGKLNENLRIGLMDIQTGGLNEFDSSGKRVKYSGENYSVLAVQQKVFSSSNIGFIFTNRQSSSKDSLNNNNAYNRLAGIEYNLTSRDGQWTGKLFEHTMFSPGKTASAQGGWLNLDSRKAQGWIGVTRADKGFSPDLGFVPRNGYTNIYADISYVIYPKSSVINTIKPVADYRIYVDSAFNRTDHFFKIGPVVDFKNTGQFYILWVGDYTKLQQPFNPSFNNGKALPTGSGYAYQSLAMYYQSDIRRRLSGNFYTQLFQYYNGHFAQFIGAVNYKIQPYGTVGLNYNLTFIRLPQPYSGNNVVAIGPQTDISFSKKLFFSSNIQYTSLNTNINYFFRLQWRFKPLSDLYIVYTNNQNTKLQQRENQGLIVKLIYFL